MKIGKWGEMSRGETSHLCRFWKKWREMIFGEQRRREKCRREKCQSGIEKCLLAHSISGDEDLISRKILQFDIRCITKNGNLKH